MAELDPNTLANIERLVNDANQKGGLASETTATALLKNIQELVKLSGGKKVTPEQRKQNDLDKNRNKTQEAHNDMAKRNINIGSALVSVFDHLRFSGLKAARDVGDLSSAFQYIGNQMPPVFELLFRGLGQLSEMLQESINTFRNLGQVGVSFGDDINNTRMVAAETGFQLDDLQGAIIKSSRAFALLSGNAELGANVFRRIILDQDFQGTRDKLTALGFQQSEVTDGLGDYLEIITRLGLAQNMNQRQLVDGSTAFLMNLDLLSKATGRQRQDILDQLQRDSADDRLRLILAGQSEESRTQIQNMLSVLETASPEMANNVKDLIANMGIPQNAAQAGLVANSNIQELLRNMLSGEGSAVDVIKMFSDLSKGGEELNAQQRQLFTFLNQQGEGYYNFNLQLTNAENLMTEYNDAQKRQQDIIDKNLTGSIQLAKGFDKLQTAIGGIVGKILQVLDPLFGKLAIGLEGMANFLNDFELNIDSTIKALGGLIIVAGGVTLAFKGIMKALGILSGIGGLGMKGAAGMGAGMKAVGAGGAAFGKGAALAGLGAGAGVGGFAALAGGGIAAGLFLVGKSLNVLAEGLERVQAIDGTALKDTADGTKMLASAIIQLGGAQLDGGVSGFFGKLFGGGTENFAKSINKTLDQLDKDKIDVYATSINNLGESMQSLSTGMQSVTTGASKSTGDKLDMLNTTMEQILFVLGSSNRYAKVTARTSTEVAENI